MLTTRGPCALWRERFIDGGLRSAGAHGFDETFARMWEFYLAYSEAGFRSGYLGLSQLQLRRARMELHGKVGLGGRRDPVESAPPPPANWPARDATVAMSARRGRHRRSAAGPTCSSSPRTSPTRARSQPRSSNECRDELGRRGGPSRWPRATEGMDPSAWDTERLRSAHPGQPRRHEQRHRGPPAGDAAAAKRVIAGIASVAGYRGASPAPRPTARARRPRSTSWSPGRIHLARTGVQGHEPVCPASCETELTAGNRFPMPFIIRRRPGRTRGRSANGL